MAKWPEVEAFIRANLKVAEKRGEILHIGFSFDDGRSQVVLVEPRPSEEWGDWVAVDSAIGIASQVDVRKALEIAEKLPCGGLARVGEYLTIRHSVPIANLDPNEILQPIEFIALFADMLEEELAGADSF